MATIAESVQIKSPGQLANNGMTVASLQASLSRGETNLNVVPKLIKSLARERAWEEFILGDHPDQIYRWSAADFRKFIEAPRPAGCQTPLHVLERLLRETDAWEVFLQLTKGNPGGQPSNQNALKSYSAGYKEDTVETNADNISIRFDCKANKTNGHKHGASAAYLTRRISRDHPDILERMKKGEYKSVRRAAIDAGIIRELTTVEKMQKLWLKMTPEEKEQFQIWTTEQL